MQDLFSVVVPLYNKRDHIERALNSVLAQSRRNWELIVINDGSTDGGATVVQAFIDQRCQHMENRVCLVNQQNDGVSSARNRGITLSKGEIICFLDADDEWESDYLEEIRSLVVAYPRAIFYAVGFKRSLKETEPKIKFTVSDSYFYLRAVGVSEIITSGVAVWRERLRSLGGFSEELRVSEDNDLYQRLSLLGPIAFSSRRAVCYHDDIAVEMRLSGDRLIRQRWPGSARRNLLNAYNSLRVSANEKRNILRYVAAGYHRGVLSRNIFRIVNAVKADAEVMGVNPFLLGLYLGQTLVQRILHYARVRVWVVHKVPMDGVRNLRF